MRSEDQRVSVARCLTVGWVHRLVTRSAVLPEPLRSELIAEGLVLLQERLSGSITYRDFSSPRRRANRLKEFTTGAIAITERRRLVVWTQRHGNHGLGRFKHIDMPLDHSLRRAIDIACDRPDQICFGYDAGLIGPGYSGRIEVRLRTHEAPQIAQRAGT